MVAIICVIAFIVLGWLTMILMGLAGSNFAEAGICIIAGLLGVVITLCAMIYEKLNKPNQK